MSIIQERTRENSLTTWNPVDDIVTTTFSQLDSILPYETLDELISAGLATVEKRKSLIFLDVDGVLNSRQSCELASSQINESYVDYLRKSFDSKCVSNFISILEAVPNAEIVVSSTWRKFPDHIELLKKVFSPYNIIGETPITKHGFRGLEIEMFLYENFRDYTVSMVILDDDSDFYDDQLKYHVRTSTSRGLSKEDTGRAIAILRNRTRKV